MRSLLLLLFSLTIISVNTLWNVQSHAYTPTISQQISSSLKIRLIQNLSLITNQTLSKLLMIDIFVDDDKERTLTEIDTKSCKQIFQIFNLRPPLCDKNEDGVVKGLQLKCLNKIWRYYIPNDEYY